MKTRYDAIIIGAGHNGLTAAAYLARAGKKVLVLERRPFLGGAATSEPIWPGFTVNTGADHAGMLQENIIRELFLKMNGLELRQTAVALFAPQPGSQQGLTLYNDVGKSQQSIAQFSPRDAERYPEFVAQVNQFTAVLREMLLQTPPHLSERHLGELVSWGNVGLKLRRMGGKPMMEFLRVLPMPLREYLNEWFESDALKGALAVDGVTGTMQGPWSAGTTLQFFYQHINGFFQRPILLGGMGTLAEALAAAARQNGADIRTETGVAKIQLDANGRAIAVLLENGGQIAASVILSAVDPRHTFFDFVGAAELEPRFSRAVRHILYRGSTAKMTLALTGVPEFVGQTAVEQLHGRIRLAPSLAYIEKGYDAAKYGRFSPQPVLDMSLPTLVDGSLAPADKHLLSIVVRYAPYQLAEGDWEAHKAGLATAVVGALSQISPNIGQLIEGQHLLTPLDYEQTYGLSEGQIFHGQMSLDQLLVMRPVSGWSHYQTPIENLYLCGAGAHPGGGVTGAPGYNAAQMVLSKLG